MKRSGGCACGAIRFEVNEPFMGVGSCHCTDCQKARGGAPSYVALAPKEGFKLISGNPAHYDKIADSGATASRVFCRDCGTPLWSTPENLPFMPISLGAFDDATGLAPEMHIFVSSAPDWHRMDESKPCFAKMPPQG